MAQPFLVAALLLTSRALHSQNPPLRPPAPSATDAKGELSAEEIFKRFASRILFLTCDESADEYSLASGVLVSADGLIVTNAHVVGECRSMRATHISGSARQSYEPVLKYYDEKTDTAVLKIAAQGLDFFALPSRPARIGERVFAIGNPRGFEQSISEGIVSGNREEDGVSWIQHSAPISPGSSGGALISSRGELLGINSRFRKESQNLNFAVPAATLAKAFLGARSLTGFLEFPPNAELTGEYSGVVQNLTAGQSADFTILVSESKGGAIQGCMAVKLPLVGSGYLRGIVQGPQLSFGVVGDFGKISFSGQRDASDLSGTYVVSSAIGGSPEKGTFVLHKVSSEGLASGFNILNCPSDVTFMRDSAEHGDATAQVNLGFWYAAGRGVPQDYAQAVAWYRKAADGGDARAEYLLGALYHDGHGVPKDYVQAAAWYLKAAAQGLAPAQVTLGVAYLAGEGVPQSYSESYFWLKVAAVGTPEVKPDDLTSTLDGIAARLSSGDLAQAQARAREWLTTHPTKAK
jgi:S1-C subfamily serine protease